MGLHSDWGEIDYVAPRVRVLDPAGVEELLAPEEPLADGQLALVLDLDSCSHTVLTGRDREDLWRAVPAIGSAILGDELAYDGIELVFECLRGEHTETPAPSDVVAAGGPICTQEGCPGFDADMTYLGWRFV